MSVNKKLFWFVYWYIFICTFGLVDVELFVVVNFLVAFFTVFNYVVPLLSFEAYIDYIIKVVKINSKFNVFLLEYLHMLFINVKKYCAALMIPIIALNLSIKVLNTQLLTNNCENEYYKSFVLKRRKIKTLSLFKTLFNSKMMLDAKSMLNIFFFIKK